MRNKILLILSIVIILFTIFLNQPDASVCAKALFGTFTPQSVTDQTPTSPMAQPDPNGSDPRYISGFGLDNAFTLFFEDRSAAGRISFVQTALP